MGAFCSDILDMGDSSYTLELFCVTHDNFDLSLDLSNTLFSITSALKNVIRI